MFKEKEEDHYGWNLVSKGEKRRKIGQGDEKGLL